MNTDLNITLFIVAVGIVGLFTFAHRAYEADKVVEKVTAKPVVEKIDRSERDQDREYLRASIRRHLAAKNSDALEDY